MALVDWIKKPSRFEIAQKFIADIRIKRSDEALEELKNGLLQDNTAAQYIDADAYVKGFQDGRYDVLNSLEEDQRNAADNRIKLQVAQARVESLEEDLASMTKNVSELNKRIALLDQTTIKDLDKANERIKELEAIVNQVNKEI